MNELIFTDLVEALEAYKRIVGRGRYYDLVPTLKQAEIIACMDSEVGCFFANRQGKTWVIGIILGKLACGVWTPRGAPKKTEYNVWISSQSAEKNASVILPMIIRIIPQGWIKWKLKEGVLIIKGPSAVVNVRLKSVEQGSSKFAGDDIDVIFLDEPHPRDIYNECLVRTVACKGVVISTMTAIGRYIDWQADYFKDKAHFFADADSNPWIDPREMKRVTVGMSEVERKIRMTGHFMDMAGARFMDEQELDWMRSILVQPKAQMKYYSEQQLSGSLEVELLEGAGEITLYDDMIDPTAIYVAGLDVSTGNGMDSTVLKIGECVWNEQLVCKEVLTFDSKTTKIPIIGAVVTHICRKYNNALLNLDRTGIGEAVLQDIVLRHGYGWFAGRMSYEDISITDKWGFKFSESTRAYLLQQFRIAISNRMLVLRNARTFEEVRAYRYDQKANRYDHLPDGHDDHIIAAGLMFLSAQQLEATVQRSAPVKKDVRKSGLFTYEELEAQAEWYEKHIGTEYFE